MAKKDKHVSETPATQMLRRAGVAYTEHPYEYVEHGGTAESSVQLGVPEHAVVIHGASGHTQGRAPAVEHSHAHASFGFGILHGLAGSSHVLGILPALALPTHRAAGAYLLSYGVGTVAAMTAFSSAIGFVASRAQFGGLRVDQGLLAACSLAAIGVGAFWLIS